MSEKIVQLNEEVIKGQLKEMVRGSVEETLNELLEQEAEKLTQAARYERNEARQGYRSGHYDRNLTTTSGDVTLHVPRLKGVSFETAIIERYRRRESSVEEALIEMYLAGVSVRRVEDITEALWGSKVSPSTISELNKKAYVHIEDCQQIIVLGLVAGRGFLILRQLLLHPVKEVLGDDGGNTVWHHNVPVGVLPDIASVVQKVLDAVIGHFLAPCVLHALLVEPIPDSRHGGPLVVTLERLTNKGGGEWVKLEALVAVDLIADGQGTAVVLGF